MRLCKFAGQPPGGLATAVVGATLSLTPPPLTKGEFSCNPQGLRPLPPLIRGTLEMT